MFLTFVVLIMSVTSVLSFHIASQLCQHHSLFLTIFVHSKFINQECGWFIESFISLMQSVHLHIPESRAYNNSSPCYSKLCFCCWCFSLQYLQNKAFNLSLTALNL
jgi:hypothetical protein